MKKISYLIFFALLFFLSCEKSNEESSILTARYVDVSDFTMYKGTDNGGVEVLFNNLKKNELLSYYFKTGYNQRFYKNISIDFNGNKITYINLNGKKIVSDYKFRNDSLFVITSDSIKEAFVALGSSENNLYRVRSLVRYPLPQEEGKEHKDTIVMSEEKVDLAKVLKLAKFDNLEDMKNLKDSIIWCNVIYMFN